jgi:hypothetical protein
MKNHLFIGLGGQGGRTLAEIRRVMCQRKYDTNDLREAHVNWDFLAIDSSMDVRNEKRIWTYFGEDLSLRQEDWLPLGSLCPGDVDILASRKDVVPWIGNREQMKSFLSQANIEGANQRRRFGRLLFAHNADNIRTGIFNQKVDGLAMRQGATNDCCFHVFASLAGGTGSGCIVDLITTIRDGYPNSSMVGGYPIFVYVYATHDYAGAADVGYFYQNQFSALRDLNALMCNSLSINLLGTDVDGRIYKGSDPIAQLLITTSLSHSNSRVSLARQISTVAESCFERIFALAAGNMNAASQQSVTGQDVIAAFSGEPLVCPERSYRFAGIGMRRWEVPHARIEELLALDCLAYSLKQALYNNWDLAKGFVDTLPEMTETESNVRIDGLCACVEMTLATKAIAPDLTDRFKSQADKLLAGVLSDASRCIDFTRIQSEIKAHYDKTFLERGAVAYFDTLKLGIRDRVQDTIRKIDQLITDAWLDPANPLALGHISSLLDSLFLRLRAGLQNGATSDSSSSNDSFPQSNTERICIARAREWDKLTPLSRWAGKMSALLRAECDDRTDICATSIHSGCRALDNAFVTALLEDLQTLRVRYGSAFGMLKSLLETTSKDATSITDELRNLNQGAGANKYEFDQAALDDYRKQFRMGQEVQTNCAHRMRLALRACFPGKALSNLDAISKRPTDKEDLEEALRKDSMASARMTQQQMEAKGAAPNLLGDSLLDRLQARFANNPQALQVEMSEFVNLATSNLHWTENYIQPSTMLGVNVGVSKMPRRLFVLGLPSHPFSAKLRTAFEGCRNAGDNFTYAFYSHNDPAQLRLLLLDYWMAARFSTVVNELSAKYAGFERMRDTAALYFCNLDPGGEADARVPILLPRVQETGIRPPPPSGLSARPRSDSSKPFTKRYPPSDKARRNSFGSILPLEQDVERPPGIGQEIAGDAVSRKALSTINQTKLLEEVQIEALLFDPLVKRSMAYVEHHFGRDVIWIRINAAVWNAITRSNDLALTLTELDAVAKIACAESNDVLALLTLLSRPGKGFLKMEYLESDSLEALKVSRDEICKQLKAWWKDKTMTDDQWRSWAGKIVVRWFPAAGEEVAK